MFFYKLGAKFTVRAIVRCFTVATKYTCVVRLFHVTTFHSVLVLFVPQLPKYGTPYASDSAVSNSLFI